MSKCRRCQGRGWVFRFIFYLDKFVPFYCSATNCKAREKLHTLHMSSLKRKKRETKK